MAERQSACTEDNGTKSRAQVSGKDERLDYGWYEVMCLRPGSGPLRNDDPRAMWTTRSSVLLNMSVRSRLTHVVATICEKRV